MQIRLFKILKNIHDLVNINKVFIFIKFFEKKKLLPGWYNTCLWKDVFTLLSLSKSESCCSKLKCIEKNEDTYSKKLKTNLKRVIRIFKFV